MPQITKAMLVYQGGIANVFAVDSFSIYDVSRRNARRLLQHAFGPCEYFARGLAAAGVIVRSAACNRAGDIINERWTLNLEDEPFSERFNPVTAN
jgi:hypothetical protein